MDPLLAFFVGMLLVCIVEQAGAVAHAEAEAHGRILAARSRWMRAPLRLPAPAR